MIVEAIIKLTGKKVKLIDSFGRKHKCEEQIDGRTIRVIYRIRELTILQYIIEDDFTRMKRGLKKI